MCNCCGTCIRWLVGFLAFLTWLLGSTIIAYTLWMLSTEENVKRVIAGAAPVTYVLLGLGALLFLNGLLGWMGSSNKRGGCLLKMFLFLCILTIAAEIGGIISLSILRVKVTDIVEEAWLETNGRTRSLIQSNLECCGLSGPSEFAKTTDPIDSSCYGKLNATSMTREETNNFGSGDVRFLHKNGCKDKLVTWIFEHKVYWLGSFGGFLLFQAISFCLSVSAVNLKSRYSSVESLDQLQSNTYM